MSLITVSYDFGSLGYFIAEKLAKELDLELYDDERLHKEALEMGVSEENLRGVEEKTPGFFDRLMGKKPEVYLDVLQSVVYKISSKNTGVIVGHGSQVLLRDFGCALHIKITAPFERRVRNLMEKRGLEEDAASRIVHSRDSEYRGFFRYAFHKDINDPLLYDLVINTEKIGIGQAVKHIIELAISDEAKECSLQALEVMECRALEKTIHARIVEAGIETTSITVEVSEPGETIVYGITNDVREQEKVVELLKTIPEVRHADVQIVVMPVGG